MSFASFLGQVVKVGLGYVGGVVVLFLAAAAYIATNFILAVTLGVIGAVLMLFGAYSQREL